MVGAQILNYRIVEKIGDGGMGSVYRAVDEMLEREVALKFLRPELAQQPDLVERFRAEAVVLARLTHQNVASLFGLHRHGADFFMAMEYVPGKTVEALIKQNTRLSVMHAAQVASHVLHALDYAHRHGVVHRDIKSANIIVTPGGNVKVMDFGIARVLGTERRTRVGFVVGTIGYMAPEQIQGLDVDGRTDIYAVGVVLYEMLTGRMPFQGTSEYAVMQAQVQQMPVPPGAFADIPPAVEACVMRALAKQPADRYQTAAEFNALLQGALRMGGGVATGSGSFARPADETREFASDPMLRVAPPAASSGRATPPPVSGPSTPPPVPGAPPVPPPASPAGPPGYTPPPFTTVSPALPPTGGRAPGQGTSAVPAGVSAAVVAPGGTAPPSLPGGPLPRPPASGTPPVPTPPPVSSPGAAVPPPLPAPVVPGPPAAAAGPPRHAAAAVPPPKPSSGLSAAVVALLGVLSLAIVGGAAFLGWQWWQARQAASSEASGVTGAGIDQASTPTEITAGGDASAAPESAPSAALQGTTSAPAATQSAAPPGQQPAPASTAAPVSSSPPPAAPRPRRSAAPEPAPESARTDVVAPPAVLDPTPPPVAPEPTPLRPVLPPATFSNVKWMRVEGSRIREVDAFMQVTDEEIRIFDRRSRAMLASAPYLQVSSATYSQGKRPRWRVDLGPAPAVTAFDDTVRTYHYVAFQGPSQFLLTRIDRDDLARLREELQKRSSIVLDQDR